MRAAKPHWKRKNRALTKARRGARLRNDALAYLTSILPRRVRTAEAEVLRSRFRKTEAAVIRHFQARMPSCLIWRRTDQRQKATREPSRVASETNCRSDPVPFAVLKY